MQHRRIAGNAFWNLVSIGSGALLAIAVPPFLTRSLPAETFGAWALVLQVAAYVNLLSFGMQTVVARHVAITVGAPERAHRDAIVSTAFWALTGAAALACALLGLAVFGLDAIFPQLSPALRPGAAAAILLVGTALALSLPASAFAGVFVGLQRNEVPAITLAATRVVLAVGVVLAAHLTGRLAAMGAAYAAATLVGIFAQYLLWRRLVDSPTVAPACVTRPAARLLADECLGLTVWSLSMLLVSGLDLVIVARLDYSMVPYFAVAATLTAFLAGVMQATSSAILPVAARMNSQGEAGSLRALVATATRLNGSLGLLAAVPLVLGGAWVLSVWVGPEYAERSATVLAVLAIAGCIRTSALPYVAAAVAAGLQRRIIVTPLMEGIVNVVASIGLGLRFGALGVALGTLLGAVVGLVALLVQHPLRAAIGAAPVRKYLTEALLPLHGVLLLVLGAFLLLPETMRRSPWTVVLGMAGVVAACAAGVLTADDRRVVVSFLGRRTSAGRGGDRSGVP
jgi:O-antigen/teichoic acid export membrane protein